MQARCSRKCTISIIAERTLHLLIKARVAHTRCAQKAGFQYTSPWYLGNNTSSGWCGNYTPYESEKISPGTYWLHHVYIWISGGWLHPSKLQGASYRGNKLGLAMSVILLWNSEKFLLDTRSRIVLIMLLVAQLFKKIYRFLRTLDGLFYVHIWSPS